MWAMLVSSGARTLSAPNDNVLFVPSRNVLLTASGWRGGFRNTSHDAARPRPSGRLEESQERTDYAKTSRRGDRAEREACSAAAEALEGQRRRCITCPARLSIEPQAGRGYQAEGVGDTQPRCLSGLWADAGSGVPGRQTRHSRRAGDGANVDDRREAVPCQPAESRQDPSVAAAPPLGKAWGPRTGNGRMAFHSSRTRGPPVFQESRRVSAVAPVIPRNRARSGARV